MNKLIALFTLLFATLFEMNVQAANFDFSKNLNPKSSLPNFLEINESVSPILFYSKIGGGLMPGGAPCVSLGIGGRYRHGHHGIDFSVNGHGFTLIFMNAYSISTKAQYLYYPKPHSNYALYLGGGVGYTSMYDDAFVPINGGVGTSHTTQFLTLDGVVGCEFRRDKKIKPILQLELSMPTIYLNDRLQSSRVPSVVLFMGVGI